MSKKSKFFKEIHEVDPIADSAKLVRERQNLGTNFVGPAGKDIGEFNWHRIEKSNTKHSSEDMYNYIFREPEMDDEDNVTYTYTKGSSEYFSEPRSSFPTFFIDNRVECRMTETMGRGCFAKEDIPVNTLIESAPCILMHQSLLKEITAIHGKTTLCEYPFGWGKDGLMAIAMGYGGIYNHKAYPNVRWRPNYEIDSIEYMTVKDIKKGEQLYVRYLPLYDLDKLWFDDEESDNIVDRWQDGEEDPGTMQSWKMFRPGSKMK